MDEATFLTRSRLLIVAGKGGVGKTTVAAALARVAEAAGLSVLVVEIESAGGIDRLLGCNPLVYEPRPVPPATGVTGRIRARALHPDDAFSEYLADHGMGVLARTLRATGVVDVLTTAVPGIRELLVLGKLKALERVGVADVVIVDTPAAGHAISMLRSPVGLADAVRAGPIRQQATEAIELLSDPDRVQVVLVTLAEETPARELVETAYRLEDEVGVQLGPVVVNRLTPAPPDGCAGSPFPWLTPAELDALRVAVEARSTRAATEKALLADLGTELPLPQLHLHQRFVPVLGPDDVVALGTELRAAIRAL